MRVQQWLAMACFATCLISGHCAWAQDNPKTPATKPTEPKKPASIFDFGVEPLHPGDDNPKPEPEPKSKPRDDGTPKVDVPSVEVPKVEVPRVEVPKVEVPQPRHKEDPKIDLDMLDMLKACHVSPDGVITVDKAITFSLKGTQGKDFVITGELYAAPKPVLFNTGGIIFHLRELSGTKRYELSIGGMRVKRVLLEGEVVKKYASPMTFKGITREEWHPFRIEVSADAITAQFGDQKGIAKGPLEKRGQNLIILGPGGKLKNLKVEIKPDKP